MVTLRAPGLNDIDHWSDFSLFLEGGYGVWKRSIAARIRDLVNENDPLSQINIEKKEEE